MSHYLDLLEKCLLGTLTKDPPMDPWSGVVLDGANGKPVVSIRDLKPTDSYWVVPGAYNDEKRRNGFDWPATAHTMIGEFRLRQLRDAVLRCLDEGIVGDFIECGVWRGGACIMMAAVLKECEHIYFGARRRVIVADSFEGLPKPVHGVDQNDEHYSFSKLLAVSEEQVRANFETYGLLSDRIVFLKGWFKDTLPTAPIDKLAVLRVDGDMYQSTIEVLEALYDKVSPGGFIIIDDYNAITSCKAAVEVFRAQHEVRVPLVQIDSAAVYWRKP